ncbi:hypothetical protein B0O99DRAFT_651352 [Bisporella sp. PMI_857]|nr:hypothetical protein B0O99DRAFT_651352 [Bisporella sp. PMI_857]
MNASTGLRFLRPYLYKDIPVTRKSVYLRFYNHASSTTDTASRAGTSYGSTTTKPTTAPAEIKEKDHAIHIIERAKELKQAYSLLYPRINNDKNAVSIAEFTNAYKDLGKGESISNDGRTLRGRIMNFRIAGKGLAFLDISQDGQATQIVCDLAHLKVDSNKQFSTFYHLIQRGDVISASGYPYTTKRGQLSLRATELPIILSPSLAKLPTVLEDRETRIRNRHVDLLVNRKVVDTLRARSHIIRYMRDFLLKDNFMEVQTPIIAEKAGGAIAKPFTTAATEFSEKQLALRIAPELWLKRMILGGMDRVFEIGPAFRNEGLDATHNPEFTTCEFYKSFADLEDLIRMTEILISGLAEHVESLRESSLYGLPAVDIGLFKAPYQRIKFIPAIEAALGHSLPDLSAADAQEQLLSIFKAHNLTPPASSSLPRLLDKLSTLYIEPRCNTPTFITHHPSCLAPLAKSFFDPTTSQHVSARVELFIHHKEVANMYEEENSPFEQRKKFKEQARWKDDENEAYIDESYLSALEWGLPPTGGWGCGIDRLCMLLSGATRIGDVLSFGSLRNVVNLGRTESGEKSSDGGEK